MRIRIRTKRDLVTDEANFSAGRRVARGARGVVRCDVDACGVSSRVGRACVHGLRVRARATRGPGRRPDRHERVSDRATDYYLYGPHHAHSTSGVHAYYYTFSPRNGRVTEVFVYGYAGRVRESKADAPTPKSLVDAEHITSDSPHAHDART